MKKQIIMGEEDDLTVYLVSTVLQGYQLSANRVDATQFPADEAARILPTLAALFSIEPGLVFSLKDT